MGKGRSRLRYSNRTKVLLCYLAAFGLPVLWMLAGLFWGYPYKLAGSAPHIAETLLGLFQGQARLATAVSAAQTSAGASPELWRQALQHREQQWLRLRLRQRLLLNPGHKGRRHCRLPLRYGEKSCGPLDFACVFAQNAIQSIVIHCWRRAR